MNLRPFSYAIFTAPFINGSRHTPILHCWSDFPTSFSDIQTIIHSFFKRTSDIHYLLKGLQTFLFNIWDTYFEMTFYQNPFPNIKQSLHVIYSFLKPSINSRMDSVTSLEALCVWLYGGGFSPTISGFSSHRLIRYPVNPERGSHQAWLGWNLVSVLRYIVWNMNY